MSAPVLPSRASPTLRVVSRLLRSRGFLPPAPPAPPPWRGLWHSPPLSRGPAQRPHHPRGLWAPLAPQHHSSPVFVRFLFRSHPRTAKRSAKRGWRQGLGEPPPPGAATRALQSQPPPPPPRARRPSRPQGRAATHTPRPCSPAKETIFGVGEAPIPRRAGGERAESLLGNGWRTTKTSDPTRARDARAGGTRRGSGADAVCAARVLAGLGSRAARGPAGGPAEPGA